MYNEKYVDTGAKPLVQVGLNASILNILCCRYRNERVQSKEFL